MPACHACTSRWGSIICPLPHFPFPWTGRCQPSTRDGPWLEVSFPLLSSLCSCVILCSLVSTWFFWGACWGFLFLWPGLTDGHTFRGQDPCNARYLCLWQVLGEQTLVGSMGLCIRSRGFGGREWVGFFRDGEWGAKPGKEAWKKSEGPPPGGRRDWVFDCRRECELIPAVLS